MSLKTRLKQVRDDYVSAQVQRVRLPIFPPSPLCRRRVRFSGRVQKVGFRQEVTELALRLELTGFCRNLEFQGPANKITFLLAFMDSLKRIKIRRKVMEDLPLLPGETGFSRQ